MWLYLGKQDWDNFRAEFQLISDKFSRIILEFWKNYNGILNFYTLWASGYYVYIYRMVFFDQILAESCSRT